VTRVERVLLWGSSAAVAVSGFGFAWTKYLARSEDPFAVVNHPWQTFFLKAHVLSAPVLVFVVGLVVSRHVARHRQSPNPGGRRSGLGIVALLFPLVASGYLIQTVTDGRILGRLVAIHLATGILYVVLVPFHNARQALRERRAARVEPRVASGTSTDGAGTA
jgi:hypothetical protein